MSFLTDHILTLPKMRSSHAEGRYVNADAYGCILIYTDRESFSEDGFHSYTRILDQKTRINFSKLDPMMVKVDPGGLTLLFPKGGAESQIRSVEGSNQELLNSAAWRQSEIETKAYITIQHDKQLRDRFKEAVLHAASVCKRTTPEPF